MPLHFVKHAHRYIFEYAQKLNGCSDHFIPFKGSKYNTRPVHQYTDRLGGFIVLLETHSLSGMQMTISIYLYVSIKCKFCHVKSTVVESTNRSHMVVYLRHRVWLSKYIIHCT